MPDPSRMTSRSSRVLVFIALLVVLTGIAEWQGWPFLAAPLQHRLSELLERRVRFDDAQPAVGQGGFTLRFLGGIRLRTAYVDIASAPWSSAPHLLQGRDVALDLRYIDLWRAWRGQPLRIESLQAASLDGHFERLADGRASWQPGSGPASDAPATLPRLDRFHITDGLLRYNDLPGDIAVEARLSVDDLPGDAAGQTGSVMKVEVTGAHRKQPVKVVLVARGMRPDSLADAQRMTVALTVNGTVGAAAFDFEGHAAGMSDLGRLTGRFRIEGPSLAAIGDPVHVTLPSTPPFRVGGALDKTGSQWRVQLDDATVGESRLDGDFLYRTDTGVPSLTGRLGGARLRLADLGPALGGAVPKKDDAKVLPSGAFDLAALRAMDADIAIDIAEVDLGSRLLGALQPLRAKLTLAAGVLSITDLDARTAQGWLKGEFGLDGRSDRALWTADLRWGDVRFEQWLRQERAHAPPYVTGSLSGRATVSGAGRSTAEILAGLKGRMHAQLRDGRISHLAVEAAGLDLAEALGLLVTGDRNLPLNCAVVEIRAEAGVLRPQVMVLDTDDSTVSVSGALSLAAETLDLTAMTLPKDFSPLTLRSPLRVQGRLAAPQVSLDKAPIGMKVAGAALLALVNPLAALIPLVDTGNSDKAGHLAAGCEALVQRGAVKKKPVR